MGTKIQKINLDLNKVDRDLKHKAQSLTPLFADEYFNKQQFVLKETDWITATPTSGEYSLSQGTLLPEYVDFTQNLDITIPANFLPFIDIQLITKTPDNLKLAGVVQFNHLSFLGDVVEVYGNGSTLIYKGGLIVMNQIFQSIGLLNGINPDHAIKVWVGETIWNDGTNDWKIWGHVGSVAEPNHLIEAYTTVDTPFSPGVLYKKIGVNWVFQSYQTQAFFPDTPGIISEIYVENGYFVLYEPVSHRGMGATVVVANELPLVADGIFYKIILGNLPSYPSDAETDPRYWNSIVLKRNQDSYTPVSEDAVMASDRQQSLFKSFNSTDTVKEKYRLNVKGKLLFEGNAITVSTLDIPKYNDTYTKVTFEEGNPKDYTRTTTNHELVSTPRYAPLTSDIEYKIKVVLTNPHDYANRSEFKQ